jgi:hypothetical protein
MKSLSKLKGMLLPAVIFVAAISSQNVLAGSYASVVNLPVLHAKGLAIKQFFRPSAALDQGSVLNT